MDVARRRFATQETLDAIRFTSFLLMKVVFRRLRSCVLGLVKSFARILIRPVIRRDLMRHAEWRFESFVIRYQESANVDAVSAVATGLLLIKLHDPMRYNRMARDMPVIWLSTATRAHYMIGLGVCVMPAKQVLEDHFSRTALILVHEATHARINKAGIAYWPRLEGRMERMCLKEEARLAARLEEAGFTGVDEYRAWLRKVESTLPQ